MSENQSVVLVGKLERDPGLSYTRGGHPVCNMSIKVGDDKDAKGVWKRVVIWGRLAEVCSVQLKKGNSIFVRGQNQMKEFIGRDGRPKRFEELNAESIGVSLMT